MLEKNVFYTVSFPSAVGCLSMMPWSWVPGVSFARVHEDIPLDLQSRAESKRVRQREAERERDPHSLRHPCPPRTHTCTHARIPCSALPAELPRETSGSQRPVDASVLLEKAGAWSHIHFYQDARSLDWPCPGPPPLTDPRGKSICTSLLATQL